MSTIKTSVKEFNQTTVSCETEGNNLGQEIKVLWKSFFLDTSLHGCSPIPKSQYHWLRRLLWFLFLAASTSTLIVYAVGFYNYHHQYPFITKNQHERVKSLPLPAISICDVKYKKSMLNNSNTLEENYNVKKNLYIQAFGEFNITETSAVELDQLTFLPLEEIGMKKEDVLLHASVNGIDVKSEFQSLTSFFGQCLTYNMVGEGGEGGNIRLSHGQNVHMILNITQEDYFPTHYGGIKMIFHDPGDFPTPASMYTTVAPGFMTKIYLSATKLKFLSKPFKSYGDEYCVKSKESTSEGMKRQTGYTWFGCVEECAVKNAVNLCNCTIKRRGFPDFLSFRVCSSAEVKECIYPIMNKVYHGILHQNNTMCDCPGACETIQYDVRTSLMTFPSKPVADFLIRRGAAASYQDLRDNYMSVDIAFERMVLNHVEHVPEIDAGDILGKIGGQMGLFLGASILTMMEIAETLLLTFLLLGRAVIRSVTTGLKVGAVQ